MFQGRGVSADVRPRPAAGGPLPAALLAAVRVVEPQPWRRSRPHQLPRHGPRRGVRFAVPPAAARAHVPAGRRRSHHFHQGIYQGNLTYRYIGLIRAIF